MGHKVDASNNLFDMYKRYYDNLPKPLQPILEKSNEKKVSFLKLKSENKIDTAGAGEVGRSDTLQALHLTEVAFYPDAKTTLLGLLQGAKNAVMIVKESTANGIGDAFYNDWVDAIEGRSEYVPVFISWLEFPNYTREFDNEAQKTALIADLKNGIYNEFEGEEELLLSMGATPEKLNWRRWAITNLCGKSVSQFHQEYPTTWQEAFVSSGRPVFPAKICMENKIKTLTAVNEKKQPLKTGDLVIQYNKELYKEYVKDGRTSYEELARIIESVEFVENPRGFFKFWTNIERGKESYRFAAGVDVAEGLEQGDRSIIRVIDRKTSEVCITWDGHIDPDLFAEELHKLWIYLNRDIHFAVERNNHGITVINKLFKLGVYQYYKENFNKGYNTQSSDLGFSTNVKTKPHIINNLNEYIRDGLFTDHEPEFWGECLTFVRNSRGQMQAEGKDSDPGTKCYDDRVMAAAIMLICSQWLPNYMDFKEPPRVARSYIQKKNKPKGETKF